MTVYQMTELVGTSNTSVSDAIRGAVERATASIDHLQWFEVKEIRGRVQSDGEPEYQVRMEFGYTLKAPEQNDRVVTPRRNSSKQARSTAAQVAAKRGERGRSDLARGFEKQGNKTRNKTR